MNPTSESSSRGTLRGVFRMPSVQTMASRKSSITNAFVNSIIPVFPPSPEDIRDALAILKIAPEDLRCAYCGDKASEWDHLRPLVVNRRPTGFVSEISNLVPSCGKCNQSKGNKDWRSWMCSSARLSPKARGVHDVDERMRRLEEFERWRPVRKIDFEAILGPEQWATYWQTCDNVVLALKRSQELADRLKSQVMKSTAR